MLIDFFAPTAGQVSVQVHREWQTSPTGVFCPEVITVETAPGAIVSVWVRMNSGGLNCPGGFDWASPWPHHTLAGSGRLATFTFTPAP